MFQIGPTVFKIETNLVWVQNLSRTGSSVHKAFKKINLALSYFRPFGPQSVSLSPVWGSHGGIFTTMEQAGADEARSPWQKFASTVSLAENTQRAVEMFKEKPGFDAIVPISPVPAHLDRPSPPSDNADVPIYISMPISGAATDLKPGDFVKCRRTVVTSEIQYCVGDRVRVNDHDILQRWVFGTVAGDNGDGTYTIKYYESVGVPDSVQRWDALLGMDSKAFNRPRFIRRTFDEKLYSAVVKAKLTDVFKEADADNDGKLTYHEWTARMGSLVPADELERLFKECDTDKNGTLDAKEFATGMAGKYEIQWAQVSMLSSLQSPASPVHHHSARLA